MAIAKQPVVRTLHLNQQQADLLEKILASDLTSGRVATHDVTVYVSVNADDLDELREVDAEGKVTFKHGSIEKSVETDVEVEPAMDFDAAEQTALSDILHELTKPVVRAVG